MVTKKISFFLLLILLFQLLCYPQNNIIGVLLESTPKAPKVIQINGALINKVTIYGTKAQIIDAVIHEKLVIQDPKCASFLKSEEQNFNSLTKVENPKPPCADFLKGPCVIIEQMAAPNVTLTAPGPPSLLPPPHEVLTNWGGQGPPRNTGTGEIQTAINRTKSCHIDEVCIDIKGKNGSVKVCCEKVDGGEICLEIGPDASFAFESKSKNGESVKWGINDGKFFISGKIEEE